MDGRAGRRQRSAADCRFDGRGGIVSHPRMRNAGRDEKSDVRGGLGWVLSYIRPHRKIFIPSLIALFLTAGLSLAFPWFLKDLVGDPADAWKEGVDAAATRQKADGKILWLLGILAVQAFVAYWRVRGFTRAGDAKAVPLAMAHRAQKEPFQITLVTGASLGKDVDRVLTEAHILKKRMPFQSDPTLREQQPF